MKKILSINKITKVLWILVMTVNIASFSVFFYHANLNSVREFLLVNMLTTIILCLVGFVIIKKDY